MTFDEAFDQLVELEGGYSNDARDPGGETRWGITRKVAVKNGYVGDMHIFPKELAKSIYKKSYWDSVRADELPNVLRYPLFDAAVNSGPSQAVQWLQAHVGVKDVDGMLGPVTVKAVWASDVQQVALNMIADRTYFLTSLPTWGGYGRGWARRIVTLLRLLAEGK